MARKSVLKVCAAAGAMAAVAVTGMFIVTPRGRADDFSGLIQSRIARGFAIAPVRLNLAGRNTQLVGLGSYFVNAVAACNDCHTNPSYLPGGDPFLGQPKKVNAAGYLGGGQTFGPFTSRNITPDASGKPAGLTLDQFFTVIRHGVDLDHRHPQISNLLQVMPWPVYQDMGDDELVAIYEYLSAIPCVEGDPGDPAPAPNRCGTKSKSR